MQARQLLTDPAVAREFERLRGVAEAKAQEVRKLQEELQAVNFSQDSKAGRLLMAKCRALQVSCTPRTLAKPRSGHPGHMQQLHQPHMDGITPSRKPH